MAGIIRGQIVVKGGAQGEALVSQQPLSFWGGYDQHSGEIIDRRHPLSGQIAAGRVLAIPFTRGSSTTTAVLLEAIKAGSAPAAILTTRVDPFLALASIVADELYTTPLAVIALPDNNFTLLQTGQHIEVYEDGRVVIQNPTSIIAQADLVFDQET